MNSHSNLKGVFFEEEAFQALESLFNKKSYSKVVLLCDANTHEHCLPPFLGKAPFIGDSNLEILELEPGEETKSIEILAQVWDAFGALEMDRKSILINIGGGVITDLGGFAAATYMRGIDFVNFPSSLLAMVDASVGSKTGINFGGFKNRIGLFSDPQMVGIIPDFLKTLAPDELKSGWAEMLKHGLIADDAHFRELINRAYKAEAFDADIIKRSIGIKAAVVNQDKYEGGLRKILNFGHTIGHALESYYHQAGQPISHGYAVGLGMIVELGLSVEYADLDAAKAKAIQLQLRAEFSFPTIKIEKETFLNLVIGDKKNSAGQLQFSLLADAGKAVYDKQIALESIWPYMEREGL